MGSLIRENKNKKQLGITGIKQVKQEPSIIDLTFKHDCNMQAANVRVTLEGGSVSLGLDISGNLFK